jgi:hypothetical protein
MVTKSADTVRMIFTRAREMSQYVSKIIIKSNNLTRHIGPTEKQIRWFEFAFWLQKYAHKNIKLRKCVEESIDILEDRVYKKVKVEHDIGRLLYELLDNASNIPIYTKIATRLGYYVGHCGNETVIISSLLCLVNVNNMQGIQSAIKLMRLVACD